MFCSPHTEWILEGPVNVSVALGENATFNCLGATSVDGFDWFMNDSKCECNDTSIGLYCCPFNKTDYGKPFTSEITVDTNYDYNYTRFYCRAYTESLQRMQDMYMYTKDVKANSSSALLTVQGMTIILL